MAYGIRKINDNFLIVYRHNIDMGPAMMDNKKKGGETAMLRKLIDFLLGKCRRERESLSAEEKLRIDMTARSR